MENQLICLDTSVIIDFYRKTDKSNSFFYKLAKNHQHFAVSAITEYEIYTGSNPKKDIFWNEFFEKVISLPYDQKVNQTAIAIERQLKRERKQIDIPDLFIAATALTNRLPIATLNTKHFEQIQGIELTSM